MIRARIPTAFICLIVCSAAASAQGPGMGWGRGPGMMLSMQDTDGDGFISEDEHAAWVASVFKTMDTNKDGRLTRSEYMAVHMGPGPHAGSSKSQMSQMSQMRASADARKAERFARMDTDKDGDVSREQFLTNGQADFAAMDTNGDGKVSMAEFRAWHHSS